VGWGLGSGIGSVDARSRPWASGDDPLYMVSCIRHLHLAITGSSVSNYRGVVRQIMS
jgi:hypothetical protein